MIEPVLNIGKNVGSATKSKLRDSVREFEAMLIADLLKTAKDETGWNEPGMDSYEDMRTQAIAMAMSEEGGIGIGKLLLNQLDRKDNPAQIKVFSGSADPQIAGDK